MTLSPNIDDIYKASKLATPKLQIATGTIVDITYRVSVTSNER